MARARIVVPEGCSHGELLEAVGALGWVERQMLYCAAFERWAEDYRGPAGSPVPAPFSAPASRGPERKSRAARRGDG